MSQTMLFTQHPDRRAEARAASVPERGTIMEIMAVCGAMVSLEDFAAWLADQFEDDHDTPSEL